MKSSLIWSNKINDINKNQQSIYGLCFKPDGTQLLVAAGESILVYNCSDGTEVQSLNGHKGTIYCIDYCKDGKKFASGGADKVVIIWTSKLEAILKYTHNDAIQSVSFNSITYTLVSCAVTDFSFWTTEQKSVQKYKISSRINVSCWNVDGQYLALGLSNGTISIRNAQGDEKYVIERPEGSDSPVWALAFSPSSKESNILCVGDWSQKLIFYNVYGEKVSKERYLGFEPLSIKYTCNGDYLLVAGCNKQCILLSRDGVYLQQITDVEESWIWTCAAHPNDSFVAVGCHSGTVSYFQLTFSTVHSLYKQYYAFRDLMTDVIVHQLVTEEKARIKCRDLVKKIAVYKNRLAVLLSSKIIIYELYNESAAKLHYRIKERIRKAFHCDLLVVCDSHIILCQDRCLTCYTFKGAIVRQWKMDSSVRYMKVIGGPPGNEGLLVGLANGQVLKIYIENPFPIELLKSTASILCIDLNISRKKIALVNEDNRCVVYDVISNQTVVQDMKGTSVCWNSFFEDMLCCSDNEMLNIKINGCSSYQHKFSGYVIGVFGSRIFSLNGSVIFTMEIPLSAPMYQCIEKLHLNEAYGVACLGVAENDWRALTRAAVENFDLPIVTKSFIKLRDLPYLDIVYDYQESREEKVKEEFIGDILAYDGKFKEASKLYQKCGLEHKALSMYTELRMFDLAQEFLGFENSTDKTLLIRKQAEWAQNINEPKAAAEMYISVGEIGKAVDIAIENGWVDMLSKLSMKLSDSDSEQLKKIAECLSSIGEMERASEIFQRLRLEENILQLYIDTKNWDAAFATIEKYPDYKQTLYAPYADWLIENDKFIEAQKAFHQAGKPEQAILVLKQLIENAVDEAGFTDAGYYHWILSRQYLDMAHNECENVENLINSFSYHDKCASIYYAYHAIHKYLEEPFTSYQPEALFNISRFLLTEIKEFRPEGVTQFSVLYSLAKQARNLGANKLAKQALDYIQKLCIPPQFQDFVDLAALMVRAKPYHDNEDLLIMCYRCSTYNPLSVSTKVASGNCCTNCKQPFIYSFVTFEVLPLIEFRLEDGISDDEAINLLQSTVQENEESETRSYIPRDDVQSLLIEDKVPSDPFTTTLMNLELDDEKFNPVLVGRETLRAMEPHTVLVCKWPLPLSYKYYKNLVPELQVVACSSCFKIFHIDDFEMEYLQKGYCPFCRVTPVEKADASSLNSEINLDEEYI